MAEIDRHKLASFIEIKRRVRGLTIRAAAEAAGVPFEQFKRARSRQFVGAGNYLVLCRWLELDPFQLLIGGDDVSRET